MDYSYRHIYTASVITTLSLLLLQISSTIHVQAYSADSTIRVYNLNLGGQIYPISYKITNATLNNIEGNTSYNGLFFNIAASSSSGSLTVILPKQLMETDCLYQQPQEARPYFVNIDGKEIPLSSVKQAISPISSDASNSGNNNIITIDFPPNTKTIAIREYAAFEPSLSSGICIGFALEKNSNGLILYNGNHNGGNDWSQTTVDKNSSSITFANPFPSRSEITLEFHLPRDIIDAKTTGNTSGAGNDAPFTFILDGTEQALSREVFSNSTARIVLVDIPAGTKQITILGTHVVPEFGMSLLAIIMTTGVVGASIAIRRKMLG
jgi:hypothetical protein